MRLLLKLLLVLALAAPAMAAAQVEASAPLRQRAEQLVPLLNGGGDAAEMFSPAFLAAVPPAQVTAISKQLTGQFGAARAIARIEAQTATSGIVVVDMERATLRLQIGVGAAAPHRIEGLRVAGSEMKGDSLPKLVAEIEALPGKTGFTVALLDGETIIAEAAHQLERPLAIGSTFKLFILAELSRSVQAGERRWTDVVPLGRRSLPSGFLHGWPETAPLTLHTLAALMISQSDNSATDALLHILGRDKVEALLPVLGVATPALNRPFLSTLEAFVLKAGPDATLPAAWLAANEAERREILSGRVAQTTREQVQPGLMMGAPNAIDTVEWFASPSDLARTMNWLRLRGDATAREILTINPGLGVAAAEPFAYFGFKGGSEPGVINLTFLIQSKKGEWRVVSGTWNDKAAAIDEAKFVALIGRAVALLR